jgi:hypothetical protein
MSMRKLRWSFAGACVFVLLLVGCGGDEAGIRGKVTDADGKSLENVEVVLKDSADEETTLRTDADGKYEFPDQPSGSYVLSITWFDVPACPGAAGLGPLSRSGDFLVAQATGAGGNVLFGVSDFEFKEGDSVEKDLEFPCP